MRLPLGLCVSRWMLRLPLGNAFAVGAMRLPLDHAFAVGLAFAIGIFIKILAGRLGSRQLFLQTIFA